MKRILCKLFGCARPECPLTTADAARTLRLIIKPSDYFYIRDEVTRDSNGQTRMFSVVIYAKEGVESGYGPTLVKALQEAVHNYRDR